MHCACDCAHLTQCNCRQVDDTRLTLSFAVREMLRDIQAQEARILEATGTAPKTRVGVFVVHNKQRPKKAELPQGVPEFVAWHLDGNPWVVYPWYATGLFSTQKMVCYNHYRYTGTRSTLRSITDWPKPHHREEELLFVVVINIDR